MAKANAWLARDTKVCGGMYVLAFDEMVVDAAGYWFGEHEKHITSLDARSFGRLFPGAPKLKPGAGPIPVRISIERAE